MKNTLPAMSAVLAIVLGNYASAVTATFTIGSPSQTSAGVYDANGALIRSLWSNVRYPAGTYTTGWNGLDDEGILRPAGSYEVRVLSGDVQYNWEGVVGNTSDSFTGSALYHSLDIILGMAVSDESIYFATGYNEQEASAFKTSTTNPRQRSKLLDKGANSYHVVTDGTTVYWSAEDPAASGGENSFVYATNTSDDLEASLASAVAKTMTHGRTFTSAIDAVSGPGSRITGLAVQKTDDYLFVSRRALNRLDVLSKSTGALVRTLIHSSPSALTVDGEDHLWMVTGATTVGKYTVANDGTLTLAATLSGLENALALAVSPDGSTLLVADAGSSQQVKAYDITATPSSDWTLGQAGGYSTGPDVTDDKFYFRKTNQTTFGYSTTATPGVDWAYIAFQPDGKFWVGDPANYRSQRFNADRTFRDRIQFLPATYRVDIDANDPTRLFANLLEFHIDYSKPLAPDNGSWTLVKNWTYGVPSNNYDNFGLLKYVTTFPQNGRTYALQRNSTGGKWELVELPPSGKLRFTGFSTANLWYSILPDGSLRSVTRCPVNPIVWQKQEVTGFDGSNNPLWTPLSTVATSPTLAADDVCIEADLASIRPFERTSSGIQLAFEAYRTPGWHLEGLDVSTGQWKWKVAPSTHANYIGPYPRDGYFDIGNNTFSLYNGGSQHASGHNIFWQFHGEGWKNGQTNIWTHLNDDGLVIGQFGQVNPSSPAQLPEGTAGMAGNGFSSDLYAAPDGSFYIYQNDEGQHGGVHRWHVTGLDSIYEESIGVILGSPQSGLHATYYNNSTVSNLEIVSTRIDPDVNFYWGTSVPSGTSLTHADHFSVRWRGFVQPRYSQTYTFYATTDDGVRVWVNDALIIDRWQDQLATEWSGTIALEADKLYRITIEYYQKTDDASVSLSWSSSSQAKEVVPSSRLFFAETGAAIPGTDLHDGLKFSTPVQNGLYGWQRNPAQDVLNASDWWQVETSRFSYRRDRPQDVRVRYRQTNGTSTLSRALLPASAGTSSTWSLKGMVSFAGEPNMQNHGQQNAGGLYLEVLDDVGKVIARMYPRSVSFNAPTNTTLFVNNEIELLHTDRATWLATIRDVPRPFEISADNGAITFVYGGYAPVTTGLHDPTANWHKPRSLRVFFFQQVINYDRIIDLAHLTFTAAP